MRNLKLVTLCLLALLLTAGGCASARSVNQASQMVVQAAEAQADYLAPFEFTLAQEYLFEAQRQLEQSDFAAARQFAKLSMDHSARALIVAQQARTCVPPGAGQ